MKEDEGLAVSSSSLIVVTTIGHPWLTLASRVLFFFAPWAYGMGYFRDECKYIQLWVNVGSKDLNTSNKHIIV